MTYDTHKNTGIRLDKTDGDTMYRTRDGRKIGPVDTTQTWGDNVAYVYDTESSKGFTAYFSNGRANGLQERDNDIVAVWGGSALEEVKYLTLKPGTYGMIKLVEGDDGIIEFWPVDTLITEDVVDDTIAVLKDVKTYLKSQKTKGQK